MNTLTAIGIFIGIPAALAALIWLFVSASSWRNSDDTPIEGMVVWSDPPAPDPGRLPREAASGALGQTGGARGTW